MITQEQLKKIYIHAKSAQIALFYQPLVDTMNYFDITTPKRQAAFLAQIGHESGSLRYVKEIASGDAYDTGRLAVNLGNTPEEDNDGERYKGRGLIMCTGTTNYKAASKYFKTDFFSHPELLEQPKWATMVAGWFWHKKRLNILADTGDFRRITKIINGGYNGYADRLSYYERACKVLGV